MLSSMRTVAHSFLAKALLMFLVVTFAVWGVGDILRSNHASYVANIGGEKISLVEFERQVGSVKRAMEAMGLQQVDTAGLENHLLRQIIMQRLANLKLHALGLSVGDAQLAETLRGIPALRKPDGTFSAENFHMLLAQQGMSEAGFLARLKDDINSRVLTDSLDTSDIALPADVLALNARASGEMRDALLVTVPLASAKAMPPSAQDLKDFYEAQKNTLYMQPERRTLEYATLSAADIDKLLDRQITDAALKERFDSEKANLKGASFDQVKEKLRAELRDEARDGAMQDLNNQVEDALAAGKPMGDALAATGIKAESRTLKDATQDAGKTDKDPLTSAVIAHGFSLNEGETSGLSVAKNGAYFIVAVKSVTQAAPKPFGQVKEDVTRRAAEEAQRDAVTEQAAALASALKKNKGGDWQSVLAAQHVSGHPVNDIARPDAGVKSPLPQPLAEAIFQHAPGEVAGPLTLPNGDAVLAVVTDVHHNPQAKVSDAARKQLSTTLNEEVLEAYYNSLAQRYPVDVNQQLLADAHKETSGE